MPLLRTHVGTTLRRYSDGRQVVDAMLEMPPEYVEQYRQGYRCIQCHHGPQREAFPKECMEWYCKFPMRERQIEMFEQMFGGDVTPEPAEEPELEELWLPPQREEGEELADDDLWLPPAA
jgi:hypothetical protein